MSCYVTAEQKARDILDRMGIKDAQSMTAGDVAELANLIAAFAAARREGAEKALWWAFMNQPQPGWTVTTTNESTTYTANEDIVGYTARGLAALGFK